MRLDREMSERFGLTAQCLVCRAIGYQRCRERIEQELEKEPEGATERESSEPASQRHENRRPPDQRPDREIHGGGMASEHGPWSVAQAGRVQCGVSSVERCLACLLELSKCKGHLGWDTSPERAGVCFSNVVLVDRLLLLRIPISCECQVHKPRLDLMCWFKRMDMGSFQLFICVWMCVISCSNLYASNIHDTASWCWMLVSVTCWMRQTT